MLNIKPDNPTRIINGKEITFKVTNRGWVYALVGKAAKTYQVNINGEVYALKDFFHQYWNTPLINNTQKIKRFKCINGLLVADRKIFIFTSEKEKANLLLMPWVNGNIWAGHIVNQIPISKTQSISLAKNLASILYDFEKRGIAHCDISSKNVFFTDDYEHLELVDIEEMYAPDFLAPPDDILPAGTPGYVPNWIRTEGAWSSIADRFAGAIMLGEMLTWHSKEVRQSASEDESFFSFNEIGTADSDRFLIVRKTLSSINQVLSEIFEKTWFSNSLEECPTLKDWYDNIPDPPKIPIFKVDPTYLDFGKIKFKPHPPEIELKISNVGNGRLEGVINSNDWIAVKPSTINLTGSGNHVTCKVSLKKNIPREIKGRPFLFPKGVTIITNGGTCVLGGSFKLPRWSF